MTNKKRELIEILLDNVNPEYWPESLPYAAQDKINGDVWAYSSLPEISGVIYGQYSSDGNDAKYILEQVIICRHWNKTIVHRDEFMKRWNERNAPVEIKTLTFSREGIDPVTVTEKMEKISIKPDADSEGWIQWNGGEMPVEKGTIIDVKYRDGIVNLHVKAGELPGCGSITYGCAIDFKHDDIPGDIIAYRLHVPQEQKTLQQLALEKFGTDWHENEGVQPVDDEILVDFQIQDKFEFELKANYFDWSLKQSVPVEKWRIHSDEKESQIDKAAESLSESIWKLNGVSPTAQQAVDGFKKAAESIGSLVSDDTKKYRDVTPEMLARLASEYEKTFSIKSQSATETQIGGDHYTKLAIQPMRYSMENGLDALQHTIIKYVTRFRDKAGIEDLEKAKHCIDMLIEHEKESK